MMNKQHFGIALVVALTLGVSGLVLAGVPAKTATLKIDVVPGSKGAVKFAHAKHAAEYKDAAGKAISCKACHHTLKTDTPTDAGSVKSCGSCHVKPGTAEKTVDGKKAPAFATMKGDKADTKSVLFHQMCVSCHKKAADASPEIKAKKIQTCKGCH